ncbi:UNVERIFIED_CONTAM: hypothetical protein Scaly_2726800 [Sesamum calycinum]|uniref:Uncharacterized protein n=1 Tax=Sesamum calycinum TaxID=2727403 RepID=A0AAW2J295_9LAMI
MAEQFTGSTTPPPPPPQPAAPPPFARHYISLRDASCPRSLWLAEEILRQLLDYWANPDFQAQSVKNKANRATNPAAATTVYCQGHPFFWAHKLKMQMEVSKKCYKKKEDGQWSGSRAAEIAIRGWKRGRVFDLALRHTTRLLDNHSPARPLLHRPRHHNHNASTLMIGPRGSRRGWSAVDHLAPSSAPPIV